MSTPFDVAQKYLVKAEPKAIPVPAMAEPAVIDCIVDERTIAVLIDSTTLGAPVWLAFDPAFDPADGIPVFYADELVLLKDKSISTLRLIYETKKSSTRSTGLGTRVRQ